MAISKKVLKEQAAREEQKAQKEHERAEKDHKELEDKKTSSAAMFKNTKVASCSKILQKNGQAVCVSFANGAPKPVDLSKNRLTEVTALS